MKLGSSFIDETARVALSTLGENTKVYKNAFVSCCCLEDNVIIGDFTRIENSKLAENVMIQRNGLINSSKLGRYSYTGKNCSIWHADIGAFCSMSWNISIGGANHDYNKVSTHSFLYAREVGLMKEHDKEYEWFKEPCIIGNDVWIAANACVCRNVIIGDGAVIAAGAIVTKDVEPYAIVGGVPAKK